MVAAPVQSSREYIIAAGLPLFVVVSAHLDYAGFLCGAQSEGHVASDTIQILLALLFLSVSPQLSHKIQVFLLQSCELGFYIVIKLCSLTSDFSRSRQTGRLAFLVKFLP